MNDEQRIRMERRATAHAALADVTRLQVVDHLTIGDASASELGAALGVPSNLLAHHLNVLQDAGLVQRHRSEGDGRRTYVSLVPEAIPGATGESGLSTPMRRPRRVLFVCTANTARSHLAAALWRRASPVTAVTAGTHPGPRIHPLALKAAHRHGLELPAVAPADLAAVRRDGDLVVTVCDRAHEDLAGVDWAHWSVPDPVPAGRARAFDAAVEQLSDRVARLARRLTTPR